MAKESCCSGSRTKTHRRRTCLSLLARGHCLALCHCCDDRASLDQENEGARAYAVAAEILKRLKEEFDPAEAGVILLCALGRLAAITRTPEPQAWRTVTSEGCHAGFQFGYLNQAEQLQPSDQKEAWGFGHA